MKTQLVLALLLVGCAHQPRGAVSLEQWSDNHPQASQELGAWVQQHPDTAARFFEWDAHHPERAREFVTWTIYHPGSRSRASRRPIRDGAISIASRSIIARGPMRS